MMRDWRDDAHETTAPQAPPAVGGRGRRHLMAADSTARPASAAERRALYLGLPGWLLVSFGAAAIGAVASADAGAFYDGLARPPWAPPGWVFAPVWTTLYALMGIASWLVWRTRGFRGAPVALSLFLLQLAVNALWTWLFFAWREGALAFAGAVLLLALVAATCMAFRRVCPLAAALLLPYLAWVGFAGALSYSVWQRNPHLLG